MREQVRRGDVYLVDLAAHGGRLLKTRPVLVVQNDVGNQVSPETIVVAVRDPRGEKIFPILVELEAGIGGLAKRSIVDCGHVNTIPKSALRRRLGRIPPSEMVRVDRALAISLGLRIV